MNDLDTLRANVRHYLKHAGLVDIAELLDALADELAFRRINSALPLHREAQACRLLASARTVREQLAAEHAHAPIFGGDCTTAPE